jgi:hypothetical protein
MNCYPNSCCNYHPGIDLANLGFGTLMASVVAMILAIIVFATFNISKWMAVFLLPWLGLFILLLSMTL